MKKFILIIPFIFILFSCGEDVTNSDGSSSTSSGSGGTSVDVTDAEDGTGGNTTVEVDPGGDTGSGAIVDVNQDDTSNVVVVILPNEEELKLVHNTIFDYINRENLYYRSTLSEYVLTNLSKENKEHCTPEEVKRQYDAWADFNCINKDTGEARLNSSGVPVCGWDSYNYKLGDFHNKNIVGVPVGFLDMASELSQKPNFIHLLGMLMLNLQNLFPYEVTKKNWK